MFGWTTGEPIRWITKKLLKFMIKKKLGNLIMGDIDLNQLEVQLKQGVLQLNNLALNVDNLNAKLGIWFPLMIKEGSIGSLLAKMPWNGKGCQIEADEVEIVLTFDMKDRSALDVERSNDSVDSFDLGMQDVSGKVNDSKKEVTGNAATDDIHEGVKTIANIIKMLLSSFQVTIKRLIVALEPNSKDQGFSSDIHRTLVLRISEIQCGTCVSEENDLNSASGVEYFMGISRLTNFMKFDGGVLELLQLSNLNDASCKSNSSSPVTDSVYNKCPSSPACLIVNGQKKGISGTLTLTIPWKNGSLDIRTLDADLCIDPIELYLRPSTVKWFLHIWKKYQILAEDKFNVTINTSMESVYHDSASHFLPSFSSSYDKSVISNGYFSHALFDNSQEKIMEGELRQPHLIPDWVPDAGQQSYGVAQRNVDLGESINQFFECFDGLRSSQSALGTSGMWNWTCSVFSAITAASNLASGSLLLEPEPQHVKTNLRAALAGISIVLFFDDDEQDKLFEPQIAVNNVDALHCLAAGCKDIAIALQVCPQELRFESTVGNLEIADCMFDENCMMQSASWKNNANDNPIEHLQYEVQRALPSFIFEEGCASDYFNSLVEPYYSLENLVKIKVFKTFGAAHCQFNRSYSSSNKNLAGTLSLRLEVPPFMFWVNLVLVNQLMNFCNEINKSIQVCDEELKSIFVHKKRELIYEDINTSSWLAMQSSNVESLKFNIVVPTGRVVLCFSENNEKVMEGYKTWNQFLALDICTPSTMQKPQAGPIMSSSLKKLASTTKSCLCLNIAEIKVYLVFPSDVDSAFSNQAYLSEEILSVSCKGGLFSTLTVLWVEAGSDNLRIVERAKNLVACEKFMDIEKCNSSEFVSITTTKDVEEINSRLRSDITLTSSCVLHIGLGAITLDLRCSQYSLLQHLFDQVNDVLSHLTRNKVSDMEESPTSQVLLLTECSYVKIVLRPEGQEKIRNSLQSELSGQWECVRLNIKQLDVLYVSNLGRQNVSLFWLAHGEGTVCGSIAGAPEQEFLLISCSKLTRNRGDGVSSNALSSRSAGLDFMSLKDHHCYHDFTSISIGCTTLVAPGGRLDWLDVISTFFIQTPEFSDSVDGHPNVKWTKQFVLKISDVGLSYEPCRKSSLSKDHLPYNENDDEPYISCLLAASYLTVSSKCADGDVSILYNFKVQDLALLLCPFHGNDAGLYSVEYLHKMRYAKVAWEALLEVSYRCDSGRAWELECSKSHFNIESCNDTTKALVRLATQLQLIFAPDMEELIIPLQNRWKNHARGGNEVIDDELETDDSDSLIIRQMKGTSVKCNVQQQVTMLGDETCADGNRSMLCDAIESEVDVFSDEKLLETYKLETLPHAQSPDRLAPLKFSSLDAASQKGCYFPELIESYCISEVDPLSELPGRSKFLPDHLVDHTDGQHGRGIDGWYRDASLHFVENHIYDANGAGFADLLTDELASSIENEHDKSESVSGRLSFTNMNLTWKMYGGCEWSTKCKTSCSATGTCGKDFTTFLEFALSGIQFQCDLFPNGCSYASKVSLSVCDLYLYDKSKNAPWKLILGYYYSKDRPRETYSKMIKLILESIRPEPLTPLDEYRIQVVFLPMLLHLQQSQLDFLVDFFGSIESNKCSEGSPTKTAVLSEQNVMEEALLPYFQNFEIWPFILRVDYHPSSVDLAALRGGKYVELVNLVPWKGVELQFKHAQAVSTYGFGGVCETVLGEWLEDISQNQVHKILQGLPTIRSLVAVGTGATKLISLPVESYKKDRKVIKGVQRGTAAFLRSISIEAVGLGVHLAANVHEILFQAEYLLTKVPRSVRSPSHAKAKSNVRCNQPKDVKHGMKKAYESLSDGLGKTATALVRAPLKRYQRGESASSALKTAVQSVPAAAIAPVSACASAAHYVLLGVRNSLDPEHKKESLEKYMGPTRQSE